MDEARIMDEALENNHMANEIIRAINNHHQEIGQQANIDVVYFYSIAGDLCPQGNILL